MEKTVKVTVNIKVARDMLSLDGFWKLAETGTDDEVFHQVLDMMTSYGAKTEIIEDAMSSEAVQLLASVADGSAGCVSMLHCDERDDCLNNDIAF
jgi:hypothetical protein